jgi:hypothetical protein
MSDLVQINLSVSKDLTDQVDTLKAKHGWSKREVVTTGVGMLAELMERHEKVAEKAEPDVGELFMRLARLMPTALEDVKVEHGRFSDGSPALIYNEKWVIGDDRNGDLMAVRKDGAQIGHISGGQIEVLAERDVEVTEIASLT